jgi:RNA polymerase sigma-70 factor, ECF subfamily
MALSELDRDLLERCLQHKPRAWDEFVERFGGVVTHVVIHTARSRGVVLPAADRCDLCVAALATIAEDDFAVLRNFRGKSSLAAYVSVIARRVVVKKLVSSLRSEG